MADWFEELSVDTGRSPKNKLPVQQLRLVVIGSIFLFLLLLLFLFKPWFTVKTDEVGIVLRLGKYNRLANPGIHLRLPRPIETVIIQPVEKVKRIEVGFRTIDTGPPASYRHVNEEAQMLTGDENVLISEIIVQYRISDPIKYSFNVYDVDNTLKGIIEAVERQVIGDYAIDAALTWGRVEIENEILQEVQAICDHYEMGVVILKVQLQDTHAPEPVEPAFLAVTSAREDQSRFINEAQGYRNSEIPKAEGEARQIIEKAEAYRAERVNRSQGSVERFSQILEEYKNAPEVTRTRLYLETLEKVLANNPKVIISGQQDEGVLKFMNISPQGFGSMFQSSPSSDKEVR